MTILLYDYHELEERTSKQLTIWKAWHTILFFCAALFGILNYAFLQSTMQLVDNNCVIYPKNLSFHWVELPNVTLARNNELNMNKTLKDGDIITSNKAQENKTAQENKPAQDNAEDTSAEDSSESHKTVKRETPESFNESYSTTGNDTENHDDETPYMTQSNVTTVEEKNVTIITGSIRRCCCVARITLIFSKSRITKLRTKTINSTHRLMLFTDRSVFGTYSTCQFAEFMPLLSTVFAIVWAAFFVMCPGGGHARHGLPRPWRILTPGLVFALVLVVLTGYGFTSTNGGLQDFCAAFHNYTNATTCSPVNQFLERGWNASWGIGGRVAATRAASAGVWVSWACAAALMLARCLAAPDFQVRKTGVYLAKDPEQKITPYLSKPQPQRTAGATYNSPSRRDNMSIRSEPTMTTEVGTVSVNHGPDSDPTSSATTPVKIQEHRF